MTLTEGIETIQDRFKGYETDGIAYAEYKRGARGYEMRRICRITDILVEPDDVLLRIDPSEEDNGEHMTVRDLLARLIALTPDCGEYSLEASESHSSPEEECAMRIDFPIVGTARDDERQLCFLAHAD